MSDKQQLFAWSRVSQDARKFGRKKLKQSTLRYFALTFALSAIMLLGACHKKAAPPPPPPPPPPPQPTPALTTSPHTVDKSPTTTLTRQTTNTTDVSIDPGVGPVQASGFQQVSPTD